MNLKLNLIGLLLMDIECYHEENSMVVNAGYSPDDIREHLQLCIEKGLVVYPTHGRDDVTTESFEPAQVTQKGRWFLITNDVALLE